MSATQTHRSSYPSGGITGGGGLIPTTPTKQLWMLMLVAYRNNCAAFGSTEVMGILQDPEGAVAYRLAFAQTSPRAGSAAGGGISAEALGGTGEITNSAFMCIFTAEGKPASGIPAWTTLLLNTLNPECSKWTDKQWDDHVKSIMAKEHLKNMHPTFKTEFNLVLL